ncbi:MAG: hypothetical protein OEZ65_00565 [Gemmatimonadota bacterium]|nr:hypothetical protein [Gemmatimonadota bacterium]MDH5758046.1 hypothetical protein [Gemmatimonadota bacterium]
MTARTPILIAVLIAMGAGSAESLRGQSLLGLRRPGIKAGSELDATWLRQPTPAGIGQVTEWLDIDLASTLFSPRLLGVELRLRPTLSQGWDDLQHSGSSQLGLFGSGALHILPGFGINGQVRGHRNQLRRHHAYGGFRDLESASWSALIRDVNPLLPVEAMYSEESIGERRVTGAGSDSFEMDRLIKSLRLHGQNSKTYFSHLRVDSHAEGMGDQQHFVQDHSIIENRQRWGKGSSSVARVERLSRWMDRDYDRWTVQETLHLRHLDIFSSEYGYRLTREHSDAWAGDSRQASVTFTQHPSSGISSALAAERLNSTHGSVSREESRLVPAIQFGTQAFFDTRISAGLSGSFAWTEQTSSGNTFGYVLDERHTVGPDGRIELDRPFALVESVHVEGATNGIAYDPGFDYRLVEEGPFVSIIILPGGRMEEGLDVSVSYRYQLDPTFDSQSMYLRGNLAITRGMLRITYSHNYRDILDGLPAGSTGSLQELNQYRVGVTWRIRLWIAEIGLSGRLDRTRTNRDDLLTRSLDATVTTQMGRSVLSDTKFTVMNGEGGSNPYVITEFGQRVRWVPMRSLQISGHLSRYDWDDLYRREHFIGTGGEVLWNVAETSVRVRFDRSAWTTSRTVGQSRLTMSVERPF